MVPLLDLAVDKIGGYDPGKDRLENASDVIDLHPAKHDEGVSRKPDTHQRLLETRAEAANRSQYDFLAAVVNSLVQAVVDLFGIVALTAGSHPDRKARGGWRHKLGEPGFADRVENTEILNSRHYFLPWLKAFTSRCRMRSLAWLKMW